MDVKKLLNKTRVIYIDTSVLMSPLHLYRFINRYEALFTACRKKIIVPNMVYQDLLKHADSHEGKIAHTAKLGIALIKQCPYLFSIEQSEYDSKKLDHSSTATELLKRLRKESEFKKQLFITNNHELSQAANKINKAHSAQVKMIYVYHVNSGGYLTDSILDKENSFRHEPQIHPTTYCTTTPITINSEDNSEYIYKYIGISLLSFALGIGTGILGISIASTNRLA